ncbi:MAG: branched-chain amino acid ABC transporter permease, partial [Haloechinothrix sp.]
MDQLLIIAMDGLVVASRVFLISAGLAVIYGVMRILNIAHGALFTLGAYAASTLVLRYLDSDLPDLGSYLVLALAAVLVGAVAGALIERGVLRWLYGHEPVLQLLATFALFLIIEDLIRIAWQGKTFNPYQPFTFLGSFTVAGVNYPGYYLLLFGAAAGMGVLMWLLLSRSRFGRLVATVTHDPEIGTALG